MKKLIALGVAAVMALSVAGCKTAEDSLRDASSLLLSAKEVRELFQGNTVTATTGDVFYWDAGGTVAGKGSYGGILKGNWNISDDGRLCISNWNSVNVPTGCYKVYFDNTTQQRKLVDINGDLKWVVMNVLNGNPNNF